MSIRGGEYIVFIKKGLNRGKNSVRPFNFYKNKDIIKNMIKDKNWGLLKRNDKERHSHSLRHRLIRRSVLW